MWIKASRLKTNPESGQTLVALLIVVVVGVILSTASVALVIINSKNASRLQIGSTALATAESGAENAILRLLRDPNYTGETLTINGNTTIITVVGTGTQTITSEARVGNFVRKIEVQVSRISGVLTVISWKEIS